MKLLSKLWHLTYAPPVLCGPYFLLTQEESMANHLRRRLLREAFPTRSRWHWGIRLALHVISWYLIIAWLTIWKSLRLEQEFSPNSTAEDTHIGALFLLAFWYGADPRFYYIYRLHERPQSEWLEFVYPQELPNWHLICGTPEDAGDRRSLADKNRFSKLLEEAGYPSIPTLQFLDRGSSLISKNLYQSQSRFYKPNHGSGMRGGFKLLYDSARDNYRLLGKTLEGARCTYNNRDSIVTCLQNHLEEGDYLVQSLLYNHPLMIERFDSENLITLRVITARNESHPVVVYVIMEISIGDTYELEFGNVDPVSGQLIESQALHNSYGSSYQKNVEPFIGQFIPNWEEARDMLCRAHDLFPELNTIGWDIAITETGPIIIEGNTGWDVAAPQELSGRSLCSALPNLRRINRGSV